MATPTPAQGNHESWEQHETQIRLERADEFTKLSPAEQQKILAEEKTKFEKMQKEAKTEFGFKPFDPVKAKADRPTPEQEAADRQQALAKFEQSLNSSPDSKPKKESPKGKEAPFDEKRFYQLFEGAVDNIKGQKPFEFQSMSLNNLGSQSSHSAKMLKLTDNSQKKDLEPGEILSRLKEKQASPNQITVRVEVNMGEDQNNNLGLTDVSFEIPLASLMDGHFIQKLTKFTNLVFFAALLHDKQKKQGLKPGAETPNSKPGEAKKPTKEQPFNKFGLIKLAENGGLQGGAGAFEQGDTSTVAFACNNGFVWGTFDQHRAPDDPKELREALDKSNTEI